MTARCWVFLALFALTGGCRDVIHVRLSADACDESGLRDVMSVYAELTRQDRSASFHVPCINTQGLVEDLAGLEALLSTFPQFEEVPTNGEWNLWVVGRSTPCGEPDTGLTLLCGKASALSMSPQSGDIWLPVDCESRVSSFEQLQEIKEQIKACERGISPWLGP